MEDKEGAQQLRVCVCVRERERERERERWGKRWGWMKGQQDGAV